MSFSTTVMFPFSRSCLGNRISRQSSTEVIEGGWYIRGKYVSRLEEQLCAYLVCRYAVATGNGLDALRLMLRAYIEMGVMQPGDEVIVPSITSAAMVFISSI